MTVSKTHRCRTWRLVSYDVRGTSVSLKCTKCPEMKVRKTTKQERAFLKQDSVLEMFQKASEVHAVLKQFRKRFLTKDERWRFEGWGLMQRVAKWAEAYPNDVHIASCDDSHFSSSYLVLIESRTSDQYMGTSVFYIPQCSGESPVQFFLYPDDRNGLIKDLQAVKKAARPIQVAERAKEVKWARKATLKFSKG